MTGTLTILPDPPPPPTPVGLIAGSGRLPVLVAEGLRSLGHPVHALGLSVGIDPARKNVLVVKSAQHFRATFQPMARRVLTVDTGALTTPELNRFDFSRIRRPIWPLDPVA